MNHEKVVTSLYMKHCKMVILRSAAFICPDVQAVKLKLFLGNKVIASQLPSGAVISGDYGLQAFRG